jgi:hypothetical protein
MFATVDEIKVANLRRGHYWFSSSTMHFFRSRVESGVIAGRYFVTSEQFDDRAPRLYTIRKANDDGTIDTFGEFQQFGTLEEARTYLEGG